MNRGFRLDPFTLRLSALAWTVYSSLVVTKRPSHSRRRLTKTLDRYVARPAASAYGHLGRTSEARDEGEASRISPDDSLEHDDVVLPDKKPADFETMVEGLRKAGLAQRRRPPPERVGARVFEVKCDGRHRLQADVR